MNKIELEVECVSVVSDVLAEAGDVLLIYNGVCVGVRSKADVAPPWESPKHRRAASPQPITDESVLAMLRGRKIGLRTIAISDRLKLSRDDATNRMRVGRIIADLAANGIIVADDPATRYPRWRIKEVVASETAP